MTSRRFDIGLLLHWLEAGLDRLIPYLFKKIFVFILLLLLQIFICQKYLFCNMTLLWRKVYSKRK